MNGLHDTVRDVTRPLNFLFGVTFIVLPARIDVFACNFSRCYTVLENGRRFCIVLFLVQIRNVTRLKRVWAYKRVFPCFVLKRSFT